MHRALIVIALVACKGDPPPDENTTRKPAPTKPAAKPTPATEPEAPPSANDGPRYLRAEPGGAMVDAFKFPSVPASIVEKQVAAASSPRDAAGILRRFGLTAPDGKTGSVWIGKASLVDRLGRERILVATFRSDAVGGMRDEDTQIVFIGSTEDDRILRIGSARIKTSTPDEAPVEVDARELHSASADTVVATWSSCGKVKACHYLRAWSMTRGYPEMIVDVAGESPPVIAPGLLPPHDVVVDGKILKFDAKSFAYR